MIRYMWNPGGDCADNGPKVLREHKDEFLALCARIRKECTDAELHFVEHHIYSDHSLKIRYYGGSRSMRCSLFCGCRGE